MLGFRSKTPWKMMIALTYYALSLIGFTKSVYMGVAVLVTAWMLPTFCISLYEALFRGRKEQIYVVPVFITAIGISLVLITAEYQMKTKSATAVVAVAETDINYESSVENAQSEDKVYITPSGGKYHRDDCRFIKDRETISITVDEALGRGKMPCSVCLK